MWPGCTCCLKAPSAALRPSLGAEGAAAAHPSHSSRPHADLAGHAVPAQVSSEPWAVSGALPSWLPLQVPGLGLPPAGLIPPTGGRAECWSP